MKLVFASSNVNKLNEIRDLLPEGYTLLSLRDLNFDEELEETSGSFEGNALQKARFVFERFKINCFADDSGLQVQALNDLPGVDSAFYAGTPRSDEGNIQKLLYDLGNSPAREARFVTVIALIYDKKEYIFKGQLQGAIALSPQGKNGFGYDPVFVPQGMNVTLAQISREEKVRISHRGLAMKQLMAFLSTISH